MTNSKGYRWRHFHRAKLLLFRRMKKYVKLKMLESKNLPRAGTGRNMDGTCQLFI